MSRTTLAAVLLASAFAFGAAPAAAQKKAAPAPAPATVPAPRPDLEIGQVAPDFALPGATRYGVLKDSVRLSSLRGQTVVIAFFYKARTKG